MSDFRSQVAHVPVFSSLLYGVVGGRVLLSAKEGGVREADELILAALRNSLTNLTASGIQASAVVPIPSRSKANRKRGRNFIHSMGERLCEQESLTQWSLLEHSRTVLDQSRLSAKQRRANLAGSMLALPTCKIGRNVILMDDLLTTGATLGEAVSTMKVGGMRVVGAITAFLALPIR